MQWRWTDCLLNQINPCGQDKWILGDIHVLQIAKVIQALSIQMDNCAEVDSGEAKYLPTDKICAIIIHHLVSHDVTLHWTLAQFSIMCWSLSSCCFLSDWMRLHKMDWRLVMGERQTEGSFDPGSGVTVEQTRTLTTHKGTRHWLQQVGSRISPCFWNQSLFEVYQFMLWISFIPNREATKKLFF